jgi:RNA polymerase sigma factor (TIGR02999 family)
LNAESATPRTSPSEVSRLLARLRSGDEQALGILLPVVYDELRRLAARQLRRERPDHTLQPTALVHEAFLRLLGGNPVDFAGRNHFFALAARAMRRVLIDHARRAVAGRRPPRSARVELSPELEPLGSGVAEPAEVLAVDAALDRLAALDERQASVVELRFFGGLSAPEAAAALGVSEATVAREWRAARAWLKRELADDAGGRRS